MHECYSKSSGFILRKLFQRVLLRQALAGKDDKVNCLRWRHDAEWRTGTHAA